MKRLLLVCILAALLCAGLAVLVQSCAPAQRIVVLQMGQSGDENG